MKPDKEYKEIIKNIATENFGQEKVLIFESIIPELGYSVKDVQQGTELPLIDPKIPHASNESWKIPEVSNFVRDYVNRMKTFDPNFSINEKDYDKIIVKDNHLAVYEPNNNKLSSFAFEGGENCQSLTKWEFKAEYYKGYMRVEVTNSDDNKKWIDKYPLTEKGYNYQNPIDASDKEETTENETNTNDVENNESSDKTE